MINYSTAKPLLRYQLTFEGAWPTAVTFLGSARKLAAANQVGQLFLWDLPPSPPPFTPSPNRDRKAPDLAPSRRLDGHSNEITRLAFTPAGNRLVSASLDRTLRIWPIDTPAEGKAEVILDADTRKREARRSGKKDPTAAPGVTVATQSQSQVLDAHQDWIHALALSAEGKRAISGDAASQVIVWDLTRAKPEPLTRWKGHPWNWIVAAALSPDGQTALVSEYRYKRDDFDIPSPALKLWEVRSAKEKLDLLSVQFPKFKADARTYGAAQVWRRFVANGLITCAFSPNGKVIAVGQGGETDTGKVHLLDSATGKLLRSISGHQYGVTDLLFSNDGNYLISAGRDTSARICRVSDGKEVATLGSPRGGQFKDWLSALSLSPDGQFLAATDIAGLVHVWEFTD